MLGLFSEGRRLLEMASRFRRNALPMQTLLSCRDAFRNLHNPVSSMLFQLAQYGLFLRIFSQDYLNSVAVCYLFLTIDLRLFYAQPLFNVCVKIVDIKRCRFAFLPSINFNPIANPLSVYTAKSKMGSQLLLASTTSHGQL